MSRQTEAHLVVEPVPRNVRVARQFLRNALQEWGSTDLEDIAVLLVSELLTNVILHAGTPGELSVLRSEGRVRVEVRDGGSPVSPLRQYALDGTTGRGLKLVSALSADWGVEPEELGKVVWFELDDADSGGQDVRRAQADAPSRRGNGGGEPNRRAQPWRDMRHAGYGRRHILHPWRWRLGYAVIAASAVHTLGRSWQVDS